MRPRDIVGLLIAASLVVVLPIPAYAQEASINGTIVDQTGGVLPGVIVTAVHEATGNSFEAVTDGVGAYRLSLRVGVFRLSAELQGFAPLTQTGLQVLVGQQVLVNFTMRPESLQESVVVTGEAPLINVASSRLGGNIDPRQVQELPLNGRNWMDLTMLAPGSRLNASDDRPSTAGVSTGGHFQINLDGQQVTNWSAPTFGQSKYSRDAIAEFEFVANRFDAAQGRSYGVQVNAITKSGTNTPGGSFSGYFRDDRLNAEDFIQRRVLPYKDQQLSSTFGGPIRRDRAHFFVNYEYEREPATYTYSSNFPRFNIDQAGTRVVHMGGTRLDFQFSPETRLTLRGAKSYVGLPVNKAGGADRHPSVAMETYRHSNDLGVTLTQVLSNRAVNVITGGYSGFFWTEKGIVKWAGGIPDQLGYGPIGSPIIQLRGYTIGQSNSLTPQRLSQGTYSVRDSLTYSSGRHNVKLGGEYLYMSFDHYLCSNCVGTLDAQGGPIPANIQDLVPVWNDVSTWNLAPLSAITRRYTRGIGDFTALTPRHVGAAWLQDDWTITPRLTLNLGVRYDVADGLFAEHVALPPFLEAGRPNDTNNIAPRLGFAFSLNDRTVMRGGFGQYFGEVSDQASWGTAQAAKVFSVEVLNDGRPDFAANPFNGPAPTFDEVLRLWNQGRQVRSATSGIASPNDLVPYSYQSSIGLQRQVGTTMAVEADYVLASTRYDQRSRNINVAYDPITGANYPFTDVTRRPYPEWGTVSIRATDGFNDYHALQTAFTKRMSDRWQASGTYSMGRTWQGEPQPLNPVGGCKYPMTGPGASNIPFSVAPDLGGESYWTGWEHRVVANGIWNVGHGFQLSGLYFYRNGIAIQSTYGGDLRRLGANATNRLRPDGTIVPRNNFREEPLNRVDLRVQRRFSLGGRRVLEGIVEVFNVLNHENYGAYITQEVSPNYGKPSFSNNIAFQPRILQLGFRFVF